MKINARDLNHHLRGQLGPVYWISGDETFLVNQAVKDIEHAAKKNGFFIERQSVSAQFKPNKFFELTHGLSLFVQKRCIIFSLDKNLKDELKKLLEKYCQKPDPHLILIFKSPKLNNTTRQKTWFKTLNHIGYDIPVWPIDPNQLPHFLIQHAKKYNLQLLPEAAVLLSHMSEGNLFSADQTLEKFSLLHHNERITAERLKSQAQDHSHFDVFDLVSAMLLGNTNRALRILRNILNSSTEPNILLWAITKEIRFLANLHQEKQTQPLSALYQKYRIWEKRSKDINAALRRVSYQNCLSFLEQAANIDKTLKGFKKDDFSLQVTRLISEFTHFEDITGAYSKR